jgi:predicted permease
VTAHGAEPPRFARALLVRCVPPEDAPFITGDLDEEFQQQLATYGAARARRWYRRQVWSSVVPLVRRRLVRHRVAVPAHRAGLEVVVQPLHHAFLQVVRNPRSSVLAIGIIGLTIGASVGIGAIVDRAVLRPLPYRDADRLVVVFNTYPGWRTREVLSRFWDRIDLSYPEYATLRERGDVFDDVAIHTADQGVYQTPERADVVRIGRATDGLLPVLGVSPVRGRWLTAADDRPGAAPVVVLSHGFWRDRFGSDPRIAGRMLTLDNERHTIVGVLPPDFQFRRVEDARTPELWLSLGRVADQQNEGNHAFRGVARLRDGVTIPQALTATTTALRGDRNPAARGARMLHQEEHERGAARPVMALFAVAVAVLLLLACATVAALQLTRIVARTREVSVRAALGASAGRIAAQLLAENVLIGLAGGVVGLYLARATMGSLVGLLPPGLPGAAGAAIDARVLLMTLALSLGTAILFGIAPVLRAIRSSPASGLIGHRTTPGSPALVALVGVQSALAVLLVVGAGLLARSMNELNRVDPGFATAQRLTFAVQLPGERYSPARAQSWLNDLDMRLRAVPGVLSVAGTSVLPLGGGSSSNSIWLESSGPESGPKPEAERRVVTPEFFRALRVPVIRGRTFEATDNEAAERVMVVSRMAAGRFWRDRDPIGDRVEVSNSWWRVVGIVEDVLDRTLESNPEPTIYVADAQWKPLGRTYVIETAVPPPQLAATVRAFVRELDPTVPVRDLRALSDVVAASTQPQRARAVLVAGYAVVATLLALLGLSGVTSYGVSRRTREFAIRSALGARADSIVLMAMRQTLLASLCGIGAGVAIAVGVTRALRGFLFGVQPADPVTFGLAVIGLAAVATLAAAVPAMRAARVNPAERLRRE